MNISIIIVNYNVSDELIHCIDSIYKYSKSKVTFEIIIVDNNSHDDSVKLIESNYNQITLIKNNSNRGFSKAINQGAKIATGEYLFLLNPDTLFIQDSLLKLLNEAKKFNKLGAIGPKLINEDKETQISTWKFPTLLNTTLSLLHLDFLNKSKNYLKEFFYKTTKVDSISGGAFFVKKNYFELLNGFDEVFFWMEDIDFCLRAQQEGLDVLFFPKTQIIHHGGKSAEKNYKITISNQLLSKIKFFKKHKSILKTFLITLLILNLSLIKFLIMLFISPFLPPYRKKMIGYLETVKSILFLRF